MDLLNWIDLKHFSMCNIHLVHWIASFSSVRFLFSHHSHLFPLSLSTSFILYPVSYRNIWNPLSFAFVYFFFSLSLSLLLMLLLLLCNSYQKFSFVHSSLLFFNAIYIVFTDIDFVVPIQHTKWGKNISDVVCLAAWHHHFDRLLHFRQKNTIYIDALTL